MSRICRFVFNLAVLFGVFFYCSVGSPTQAESGEDEFGDAQINRIINQVLTVEDIRQSDPTINPAKKGQQLGPYHAVRTRPKSRAEIVFDDGSVARVGEDSMMTFSKKERTVNIGKGAGLIQVPKGSENTNVRTATATASLTGTTVMVGQRPNQSMKAIVIEGSMNISQPDRAGESRSLEAGDMVVMQADATRIPEPVKVDLQELSNSSTLVNGFEADDDESSDQTSEDAANVAESSQPSVAGENETAESNETTDIPTSGLDETQMNSGIEQQQKQLENGELEQTNMVLEDDGTDVVLDETDDSQTDLETTSTPKDSTEQVTTTNETTQSNTFDPELSLTSGDDFFTGDLTNPPAVNGLSGQDIGSGITFPGTGMTNDEFINWAASSVFGGHKGIVKANGIQMDDFPTTSGTWEAAGLVSTGDFRFGEDPLTIDGSKSSILMGTLKDNQTWDLPDINVTSGMELALFTAGAGSTLQLGNINSTSRIVGMSRNSISISSGANLVTDQPINLTTVNGSISTDNNTMESANTNIVLDGQSPSASINVTNSSELKILANNSINVQTTGGKITIANNSKVGYFDGTNFATGSGNVVIDTQNTSEEGTVSIKDSLVRAQVVKIRAAGTNGLIEIGGSELRSNSGTEIMDLHAPGSNSTIRFTDSTIISNSGTKAVSMKASTVRIDNGVEVQVLGDLAVYADNKLYRSQANTPGNVCDGNQCGKFVSIAGGLPKNILIEDTKAAGGNF